MVNPLHSLAVGPLALSRLAVLRGVGAEAVLAAVSPLSHVDPTVRPDKPTVAVLLIILVLSFVAAAVLPVEES